jgi:glycosyltransferase involved in cell wall biosynthesis
MNTPAIDVIIAVYNGEKFIRESIESVLAQSWPNVNLILADDGSEDQTLSIAREISQKNPRMHVLTLPHRGVSATLNTAIKYSSAPYIAFLDADDLWHSEKLSKQMEALSESNCQMCFCLMQEFEAVDKSLISGHKARKESIKGYSKIAFLAQREIFETNGMFDENIAIGDFVEWYSRAIRKGQSVIMLDEVLAYRRVHDANTMLTAPKSAFLGLLKKHLDETRSRT